MNHCFNFSKDMWKEEDFYHAGIYAIDHRKPFEQEGDCIKNGFAPHIFKPDTAKMTGGDEEIIGMDHNDYAFTTYIFKEKLKAPIKITSDFSFDSFGAPTFLFGEGVKKENDFFVSASHVEVTVWENGINFWNIVLEESNHKTTLIHHEKFDVPGGKHHVEIEFGRDEIKVNLDGRASKISYPVFKEGYFGFIGCEGMNRFYNITLCTIE